MKKKTLERYLRGDSLIFYDIETLRTPDQVEGGWENPAAMGFGTAVAYLELTDMFYFFGPGDKDGLIKLMGLPDAIAVTFNGVKFDNRVLLGNDCYEKEAVPWRNVDILRLVLYAKYGTYSVEEAEERHGKKNVHNGDIGLDGLAEGTLGMNKTGKGAHAPALIREAKWAEVFAYNLHDVRLTVKLFWFLLQNGYLITRQGEVVYIQPQLVEKGTDLEKNGRL